MKKLFYLLSLLFFYNISATSINYLFCHGVGGNKDQIKYYQYYGLLPAEAKSFNFNDWHDGVFDQTKTALGQKADIEIITCNYNLLKDGTSPIVVYGVSRGASAVINFVGIEKPSNVAALILESPFAHIDDVFSNAVPCASLFPKNFILRLLYPSYNPNGEQPINYINAIHSDIPIAFVCSKKDALIPHKSTMKLYNKLIESGRKKCSLISFGTRYACKFTWPRRIYIFYSCFF